MENIWEEINEKLGKLQRNKAQMTPEQVKRYSRQLEALQNKITQLADEIARCYILSGVIILKDDPEKDAYVEEIKRILHDEESERTKVEAKRVLLDTYDITKFLTALLPIHNRIWYDGYAPYWCQHCYIPDQEEIERDGWGDYIAYNDIIEMWYDATSGVWVSESGSAMIMMPPTMELIRKRRKEEGR